MKVLDNDADIAKAMSRARLEGFIGQVIVLVVVLFMFTYLFGAESLIAFLMPLAGFAVVMIFIVLCDYFF